ncbi:VirB8/TrbF family protein, partial [Kingella kingae]|uniref:VirB8/TrbF family protein n=1 Tax=Kingella kingae TaxID=504 RepID=UPI0039AEAE1E
MGAVVGLTPLKTVHPFVIRVDNNTGATMLLPPGKSRKKARAIFIDKFWLAQYVRFR